MKVKKYLQQQSQRMAEEMITEEDRKFAESLPLNPQVQRKGNRFWATVYGGAALLVVAIILVPTLLITLNNPILYKDENIIWRASQPNDLLTDSRYFNFSFDNSWTTDHIAIYYDSVSNDKLYYTYEAANNNVKLLLTVVINEKYNYSFKFEAQKTATTAHYDINYEKILSETDLPDIVSAEYRGEIKVQTETVYFTYTQTIATDDETFLADIQSLIQVKE